jgi:hypothetical protein
MGPAHEQFGLHHRRKAHSMTERVERMRRGPDGEPVLSVHALALIVGVDVDQVRKVVGDVETADIMSLPFDWVKAGFDTCNEAFAANGTNDLSAALLHLAWQQGDDVVMDESAVVWLGADD